MLPHGPIQTGATHQLWLTNFSADHKFAVTRKRRKNVRRSYKLLFLSVCFCSTDSREETVLGSIPLPSYVIAPVEPDDHISRKYAFKVILSNLLLMMLHHLLKQFLKI